MQVKDLIKLKSSRSFSEIKDIISRTAKGMSSVQTEKAAIGPYANVRIVNSRPIVVQEAAGRKAMI